MTLSVDDAACVRKSYAIIRSAPGNYAELFYHQLFLRHPFTRVLFPDDITHQVDIFRQTIDALIDQLHNLTSLHPTLVDLARRHARYGVEPRHYAFVGEVLIDTFAQIQGEDFDTRTRAAWNALYADTAGVMIAAAYPANERT